jgi:hypothetical protein
VGTDVPSDLQDGTYVAWKAETCEGDGTSWIGAYERRYIERNWVVLQHYRDAIQVSPDGPFTFKDIKWEYRPPRMQSSMGKRKCALGGEKGERFMVAYILWIRLVDFITGEEKHRIDV